MTFTKRRKSPKTRIPNLTLPKQKHPYYKNEWGQLHQIGTNHILYVLKNAQYILRGGVRNNFNQSASIFGR